MTNKFPAHSRWRWTRWWNKERCLRCSATWLNYCDMAVSVRPPVRNIETYILLIYWIVCWNWFHFFLFLRRFLLLTKLINFKPNIHLPSQEKCINSHDLFLFVGCVCRAVWQTNVWLSVPVAYMHACTCAHRRLCVCVFHGVCIYALYVCGFDNRLLSLKGRFRIQ